MVSKILFLFIVISIELSLINGEITDSTYIGCFEDSSSRHFTNLKNFGESLTLAACRQHCLGYRYFGLQASDWCNCGDTLYKEGHPLVADSECSKACTGNSQTICGGKWRNSIYFV